MYLAVITTTAEALGGTYAVLGKRRSQVLSETIREGTGVFVIHAYLPVATAFGFVDQLRAQTSGASTAQLVFSHWTSIEMDPFFTPTTEEEREEYGEDGDVGPNIARQLMDSVRRRKGLKVRLVSSIQSSSTNQHIFHHGDRLKKRLFKSPLSNVHWPERHEVFVSKSFRSELPKPSEWPARKRSWLAVQSFPYTHSTRPILRVHRNQWIHLLARRELSPCSRHV
jgi:hypothetical protein